jgi:hypothetical protein
MQIANIQASERTLRYFYHDAFPEKLRRTKNGTTVPKTSVKNNTRE